jgi:peptidoglycan/xylan/chitin deacetylase (PgdA/CDA1 family)
MINWKQLFVKWLAIVAYWLGVDALFYFLNRRAKRILTFHNVLPDDLFDPRGNGVSNKESDFRKIVDEVGRKFRYSVDVSDARSATITFDDGFLNQYEVAGNVLKERGISAIIFTAGDVVGCKAENTLVVDLLLHWCGYAPIEAIGKAFPIGDGISRDIYCVRELWPEFCKDVEGHGRNLLKRLNAIYPIDEVLARLTDEYKRLRLSGISKVQLDELRARGWIIGWHTKTHFPLSALADEDIRDELDSPPEYRNQVLSYPYGEVRSVDERALIIAEELGYPCAVSNLPMLNKLIGKFFIPRMALPADKYRLHFRLSGVECFIKTHKLLPVV